jgi:hypothetical protein
MSFVGEPYLADIFISYSHGDVRGTGDANFRQWSRCFWRELQREFEAHDDLAGLSIFFDSSDRPSEGVDPFVALDPRLEEQASNAAVFIPLISPRYLKSEWCLRELAWWREAQEKRRLDTRGRLAPVLIWGIPPAGSGSWPEALKEIGLSQITGINFFPRDKVLMRPQPFGWPGWGDRVEDHRFYDPLLDLVGYLRHHLFEFKAIVEESRTVMGAKPIVEDGVKPSIYLHGRDDSPKEWDLAADALTDAGFPVSPDGPEPVETDAARRAAIRESRIGAMSACDALLVVGPQDSATFNEELIVLGKSDRGLAIDRAERVLGLPGKKLPCAVVDTVSDPLRARRRKAWAENNRLGWFDLADPGWVVRAAEWLGSAIR